MNTQILIVRRLLPFALTCALFAVIAPAAQAQTDESPNHLQTRAVGNRCHNVLVVISGTSASVKDVTCTHGSLAFSLPGDKDIRAGKPVILTLEEGAVNGPDCVIRVKGGGNTALLSVQQNLCALEAGDITASVQSGSATFRGSREGSFGNDLPGLVWFTVDF